ncbi:MAG TPA: hypothetical protein VMJ33_02500 [Gallionella sp.]|nr:hypothetical protein [Gallionella sp.]
MTRETGSIPQEPAPFPSSAVFFAVTGLKVLRLFWGMFKVNALFARRQF